MKKTKAILMALSVIATASVSTAFASGGDTVTCPELRLAYQGHNYVQKHDDYYNVGYTLTEGGLTWQGFLTETPSQDQPIPNELSAERYADSAMLNTLVNPATPDARHHSGSYFCSTQYNINKINPNTTEIFFYADEKSTGKSAFDWSTVMERYHEATHS